MLNLAVFLLPLSIASALATSLLTPPPCKDTCPKLEMIEVSLLVVNSETRNSFLKMEKARTQNFGLNPKRLEIAVVDTWDQFTKLIQDYSENCKKIKKLVIQASGKKGIFKLSEIPGGTLNVYDRNFKEEIEPLYNKGCIFAENAELKFDGYEFNEDNCEDEFLSSEFARTLASLSKGLKSELASIMPLNNIEIATDKAQKCRKSIAHARASLLAVQDELRNCSITIRNLPLYNDAEEAANTYIKTQANCLLEKVSDICDPSPTFNSCYFENSRCSASTYNWAMKTYHHTVANLEELKAKKKLHCPAHPLGPVPSAYIGPK
jgi:hypothetical protein